MTDRGSTLLVLTLLAGQSLKSIAVSLKEMEKCR